MLEKALGGRLKGHFRAARWKLGHKGGPPCHNALQESLHGLPAHQFYHAAFVPNRWNGTETALGLRYRDC